MGGPRNGPKFDNCRTHVAGCTRSPLRSQGPTLPVGQVGACRVSPSGRTPSGRAAAMETFQALGVCMMSNSCCSRRSDSFCCVESKAVHGPQIDCILSSFEVLFGGLAPHRLHTQS